MKKQHFFFTLLAVIVFTSQGFSQFTNNESIFKSYDRFIQQIQEQNGKLYAPESYNKAVKYYAQAMEMYEKREGSMEKIKDKLEKSKRYALEALKNIQKVESELSDVIAARDRALDANAAQYAPKLWEKAEDAFKDAIEEIADNDIEDAQEEGQKAKEYFEQARVMALTNAILEEPRLLIKKAESVGAREWSYHTYQTAVNTLDETEQLIKENPDQLDSARTRAEEASYHARHAIYLAKIIKELSNKKENWELVFLRFEDYLTNIGVPFNYRPPFDNGFDEAVDAILAYISNLKEENKRLLAENESLKEELSRVKEKETNVSSALKKQMELQKKINTIKELFSPDEAEVILQNENLLIRLSGLKFQPGRAIIQPEYFSLLTKVQRAIREFPDSYILIEGHTDATGNPYKNKILSERRALAVKEYLTANLDLKETQIESIGMGDQKPIASNRTAEGRERNRRIDIYITLPKIQ